MITEESYLEAKKIVEAYESEQLNKPDMLKSVCERKEHIWTYDGTDKTKTLMLNKCIKCGTIASLPMPNPF